MNSFCQHDRPKLFDRDLKIGVYENIVISAEVLNLPAGFLKPSFDNCGVDMVGKVTSFEPCFQLVTRWGEDENTYSAGNFCLKLRRTLHIDVEHQVAAAGQCLSHKVLCGPVALSEDLCVL